MASDNAQAVWRASATLAFFAWVGVVLLIAVQWLTKDQIAENARQMKLQRLHEIVSASDYDNDLLASAESKLTPVRSLARLAKKYTALQSGEVIAEIYEVTTLQGYTGAISLLVGVNADLSLRGVRVVSHKETPGLGDKIETGKDDWILQFAGKSLQNPPEQRWKVRKDGGDFDQFTGATITPRAVVSAVLETLRMADRQRQTASGEGS